MRSSQGFAVGSGYHTSDKAYGDIRAIPIKDGAELEVGWIVRGNYVLPEAAEQLTTLMEELEMR